MQKVVKILFFLSITFRAIGINYVSISSGNWTEGSVWQGGIVPPVTIATVDNIIISANHEITLNSTLTFNNTCEVTVNGNLLITGNVITNYPLTMKITGRMAIDGAFTANNNQTTIITGDLLVSQNFTVNITADISLNGSLTVYGNFTGANNNNYLTGNGEINTQGNFTGMNISGYHGIIDDYISNNIGLSINGGAIHIGTGAAIYVDGGFKGNVNSIFVGGKDGRIDCDGKIILEGNWKNYSSDSIFKNVDAFGSVTFSGTSSQDIGGSKATQFENLITNNASGTTIDDNVLIANTLSFNEGNITTGSTDTVIILNSNPSSILNESSIKNVSGNLRRYLSTGIYSFPLALGGDYLPAILEISSLGAMHYLSAKFNSTASESVPSDLNVDGTPIVEFLNRGYWTFTPDNGTGVQYDITLTSSGHTNGGAEAAQHAVFKRSGGDWENVGDHDNLTQSGTETSPITAKRSNLTNFSDFIIGKSDLWPLPIILSSFYTICHENGIYVNWETESEINNESFTLEYSMNGTDFSRLDQVPGAGTSHQVTKYSFFHRIVTNQVVYYRLSQADYNGKQIVFPLLAAQCLVNPFEGLQVFKTGGSTIDYSFYSHTEESYTLTLNDPIGRLLYSEKSATILGFNQYSVSLPPVIRGVYIFRLVSSKHQFSKKIILE
ncbi:MAG: hypothetical protein WCX31_08635 [Salinivirgaceae bacterium]